MTEPEGARWGLGGRPVPAVPYHVLVAATSQVEG